MSVSKKRVFVRKLAVVAVSAGVVVSLAGCATGPLAFSGCAPVYAAGGNTALIEASGPLSADPEASFPTPLVAEGVQSDTVIEGNGERVSEGDITRLQVTVYDAATGTQIISTGHDSAGLAVSVTEREPHFGDIAQCATVGSRIVTVGTAGDLLGTETIDQNQLALNLDDTIVMVSDVEERFAGKADGVDQLPPAGTPAIVTAPNGQPGFSFPTSGPPSEVISATLKRGSGETLTEGDVAVLHMSGIEWGAKNTFANTWENAGVPTNLPLNVDAIVAGGLPVGIAEALIGQKVGSQVLLVLPPEAGFAPGAAPAGVTSGSTIVFVFDILGIQEQ